MIFQDPFTLKRFLNPDELVADSDKPAFMHCCDCDRWFLPEPNDLKTFKCPHCKDIVLYDANGNPIEKRDAVLYFPVKRIVDNPINKEPI